MVDKVDIEEEEKGEDKRDQHSHNIKTDPTKEHCNDGDGVVGDEEDGCGVCSDSAILRSMLTASSGVVGAHHINGVAAGNNEELDSSITAGGVGAGTVMFVPSSPWSNNMAEVSADVDVEATPVCPDAWLVDDEVQVAVEVLQDDGNSENKPEEEREEDDGEEPSKDFHEQPKRINVFLGLLAFCAVVGISVAVAVPLSRRPTPEEEEPDTIDQAVPWEVSTTSSTTDDGKVHKAPVPSFISDALSVKYTQFSQGILRAPGLASFYGDCRTAAMSVDEGVQTVKYNEINDMWDVMNELREDGFGAAEIELAKINQVLAVSRPSDGPNSTGSIRVYSLTELNSDQKCSSLGDDIDGTNPSLSVEGDVLASVVQGADGDDRVRVYRFDTKNWAQLGSDIIVGESRKTYARISQFGNYLVLGATLEFGLGSLTVFKLNGEEEWSQVGKTQYDKSSDYPPLINVHGDTIATSGVDIEGLPRASVYRLVEDEWTQEGNFDGVITAMSADGKRLGMCLSQQQVCSVHNYYDISKEYGEVARYTDFVPLHFERGGFSNLESGVCGIATSNSKTTIGHTTVPW